MKEMIKHYNIVRLY